MPDHPARNPFPARGTSSAEETSLPEFLRDWADHTPTALLPGVCGAVRLAEEYVRGFRDGTTRDGGLGCLYGAHGVGKTHAARHMMAFADGEDAQTVQLYLRFQEDDFVAAYRRLVSQLSQSLLAELSLRYLGALAGSHASVLGAADQVASKLEQDPAAVFDLFGAHLVEAGEVLEAQAREIAAVTGNAPQFQRALSFLLRPEYSEAAYDWLCGRPIGPDAARALGVNGQIDDPLTCRYGLQLLTTLVTRGGRPFVLILDQCEKFLLADGVPVPGNVGVIQSLVEVIPQVRGMLLLVCSEAGWECMPPDLRQRIGAGAFHMVPLTPEEARLVLGAYLNSARPGPDAGISPFTDTALLELLRHSGGNVRLLLQLSWTAFEAAAPRTTIDADLVADAAVRHGRPLTLSDLAMLVETRLLAAGLPAQRAKGTARTEVFRLPDARDPRAIIRLSEAVFSGGDVADTEGEGPGRDPRNDNRPVFTALLVTGYISPSVRAALAGSAHRILVADASPAFSSALDELVEQIAVAVAGQEHAEQDPATLDETLRGLRSQLEELTSERRGQSAERLEREELSASSDWAPRRQELESRVFEARAARTKADWEEFRKARAEIVGAYRVRRWTMCACAGATLLLVVFGLVTHAFAPISAVSALLAAAALGTLAGAVVITKRWAAMTAGRPGAPLVSERDLDQLARELRPHARPDSADPVLRYAYALKEDPDQGYEQLADALMVEHLALVRQALARRMATSKRPPVACVTEVLRGLRERVPEVLLLLARRQPHGGLDRPPRALRELPPELRILVALANPGALELADGPVSRQPAEAVLAALGVRGQRHPLARAFRKGVAEISPIEIPPSELRAAARLLSPLERDGLGAYDWLPHIAETDELFLFFEELLHHQEKIRTFRHKQDTRPQP